MFPRLDEVLQLGRDLLDAIRELTTELRIARGGAAQEIRRYFEERDRV